ncbi:MAG: S-adenosylmethionine decarboxylase [Planctomycetaceae bacterium]|jgi:S-adenosylmethionine decarboxylase
MSEGPITLGHHWIVDLHGCPSKLLDDHELIRNRLRETTEQFGLTLLDIVSNKFEPQGVTVVGLLAESHLSIHTWPEHGYAAVDIFTCGSDQNLEAACEFIAESLQAKQSTVLRLRRGVMTGEDRSLITTASERHSRRDHAKPPSAEELVGPPPLCLDQQWALKDFLGKSVDEAEEMCRNNPPVTEDFSYMAPAGLVYYLPAALNYLISDESKEDWEFAHGLMCALSIKVEIYGLQGPALTMVSEIAEFCDGQRAKFDLGGEQDLFDGYLEVIRKINQ